MYLVLQFSCFIITNGLATFSNIIVNNLGFNVRQTQLLNLAQGAWSIMVFIGSAWRAKKTQQTCLVLILFMGESSAGRADDSYRYGRYHCACGCTYHTSERTGNADCLL